MNTVFYGYKLKKENMWETLKSIRSYYQEEHVYKVILDSFIEETNKHVEGQLELFVKLREHEKELHDKIEQVYGEVYLQVLDYDETYYLIYPLETGYMFYNNYHQWDVEEYFYNSSDEFLPAQPKEKEKRYQTASWATKRISNKEYFLYPLLTKEDWNAWSLTHASQVMKKK